MVNLALYGLGLRIDETLDLFQKLSTRIFRGRSRFGFGVAAAAYTLLMSYRNGRFPAEDINGTLAELFDQTTMLEHPYMTSIGARIGFPVINVDTLDTCIITSYHGVGRITADTVTNERESHEVLPSIEPPKEILVSIGPDGTATNERESYKVLRCDGPHNEILVRDA